MGCNCGAKSKASPTQSLATFDGPVYTGPHRFEYVYVVARGTPEERLFRRDQLSEATAYSAEVKKGIVPLPAGTLATSAVASIYVD